MYIYSTYRRQIVFTLRPPWSSCRLPQPFPFHSKCVSACCLRQSFRDSTTAVVDPQQYVPPSSGPSNEGVCSSIQVLVISPQLRPSFDAVCVSIFFLVIKSSLYLYYRQDRPPRRPLECEENSTFSSFKLVSDVNLTFPMITQFHLSLYFRLRVFPLAGRLGFTSVSDQRVS